MPGLNGTGPLGQGSMTGRGAGYCNTGNIQQNQGFGRGMGRGMRRGAGFGQGMGFGRGFGMGFGAQYRQPTKAEETANTKAYIQDLEAKLQDAQGYLKDLQGKK